MVECDYCEATFGDEDAYLAHLQDAHDEEELGSIDQRRVADLEAEDGLSVPTGPVVLGVILLVAAGLVLALTVLTGSGGGGGDDVSIPDRGAESVISHVQTEPASSVQHVDPGTEINYSTVPPTGGTHYGSTVSAGFYEEPKPYGALVHSLEHGAVVVYYDPSAISEAARANLTKFANTYTGTWKSFIAVPNPEDDPQAAYVLTAWEHRLLMASYDQETVREFTGEYLGRGPENPVR